MRAEMLDRLAMRREPRKTEPRHERMQSIYMFVLTGPYLLVCFNIMASEQHN